MSTWVLSTQVVYGSVKKRGMLRRLRIAGFWAIP